MVTCKIKTLHKYFSRRRPHVVKTFVQHFYYLRRKKVMFFLAVCVSACPSVSKISKKYELILTKFFWKGRACFKDQSRTSDFKGFLERIFLRRVGRGGPRKNPIRFWWRSRSRPGSRFFSGSLNFLKEFFIYCDSFRQAKIKYEDPRWMYAPCRVLSSFFTCNHSLFSNLLDSTNFLQDLCTIFSGWNIYFSCRCGHVRIKH